MLDAGAALLSEVGYARTSVAQITKRAGRAHGTFYLHFDNKRELVSVLLDDMAEEARLAAREVWRTTSDVEAIWLTLRGFLERISPERSLWLLLEEVVAVEEDAAPLRTRLRHLYVEPVLRSLQQRREAFPADADLELIADTLTSTGLYFARTGTLPAPVDVTAVHYTAVWCRSIGQPFTAQDAARLSAGVGPV